jgi:hypothetical protein
MELAAFIGVPFSEFWDTTPFELNLTAKGFARRNEMEQKQSVRQAYLISRWVWAKKINIKSILEPKKEKKQMTDDEMLRQVRILNKLFGGTEKG